jgi:hypothetical protein
MLDHSSPSSKRRPCRPNDPQASQWKNFGETVAYIPFDYTKNTHHLYSRRHRHDPRALVAGSHQNGGSARHLIRPALATMMVPFPS